MDKFEPTEHKVKKGEDLTGIAKKYKHKNWKAIWEAPENKKIVSERKSPEKIQVGDWLVIPPNEVQRKELEAMRAGETALQEALTAERYRLNEEIELIDDVIKTTEATVETAKKSTAKLIKELNDEATKVDIAAFILMFAKEIAMLWIAQRAAIKKVIYDIKVLNKEVKDRLMSMKSEKNGLAAAALPAARTVEDDDSDFEAIAYIFFESAQKGASVAYWSNTYYQVREKGKPLVDAMRTEIGDDIQEKADGLTKDIEKTNDKFKAEKAAKLKRLRDINGFIGETQKRIKNLPAVR